MSELLVVNAERLQGDRRQCVQVRTLSLTVLADSLWGQGWE